MLKHAGHPVLKRRVMQEAAVEMLVAGSAPGQDEAMGAAHHPSAASSPVSFPAVEPDPQVFSLITDRLVLVDLAAGGCVAPSGRSKPSRWK